MQLSLFYRSPSETRDTLETFADNLELTLDKLTNNNLFLIVAIGDFNAGTTVIRMIRHLTKA